MSTRSTSTTSTRTFQTPSPINEVPKPKRSIVFPNITKRRLPWLLVTVLIVVVLFLFIQYHDASQKLNNNSATYNAKVTAQLNKLIELPSDQPTIATVKNVSKISSLPFYKHAQNGDILFVYSSEREAILYRPSDNRIINISTDVQTAPATSKVGN